VTVTSQAGLLLLRKYSTIGLASAHLLHMTYDNAKNGSRVKKKKETMGCVAQLVVTSSAINSPE